MELSINMSVMLAKERIQIEKKQQQQQQKKGES